MDRQLINRILIQFTSVRWQCSLTGGFTPREVPLAVKQASVVVTRLARQHPCMNDGYPLRRRPLTLPHPKTQRFHFACKYKSTSLGCTLVVHNLPVFDSPCWQCFWSMYARFMPCVILGKSPVRFTYPGQIVFFSSRQSKSLETYERTYVLCLVLHDWSQLLELCESECRHFQYKNR